MPESDPSFINQVQPHLPPCSRCGAVTMLARIEPASRRGHDIRTFMCTICGNSDALEICAARSVSRAPVGTGCPHDA